MTGVLQGFFFRKMFEKRVQKSGNAASLAFRLQ